MAEFTWKFSEREKNGLADIHLYGFQSAGTSIDQPRRGYPEITISSFDVFYKNEGFYLEGV